MPKTKPRKQERPTPSEGKPARPKPRAQYLLLVLLGLGAFGATFALVRAAHRPPPGMVWVPGGEFTMGTDDRIGWVDEKPSHRVRVDGFWMDATDVTNRQFKEFVGATAYVTVAERKPRAEGRDRWR